jgi:hypothetical protein
MEREAPPETNNTAWRQAVAILAAAFVARLALALSVPRVTDEAYDREVSRRHARG